MDGKATTARERARIEITAEILAAARVRLSQHGPGQLSLRAVSRDVGMVSSAVYRYFRSRDDLLTALLIEAYNELGAAAEDADAAVGNRSAYLERWTATCTAIRTWAISHPGDYALLYGSPVPGYAAPQDTIPAATRVTIVLVRIVLDAHADGATVRPPPPLTPKSLGKTLAGALEFIKTLDAPPAAQDPEVALHTIAAWSAIFGTISFELFGHLVGSVSDYDAYYEQVLIRLADDLGLA
ncbi:MAG: TetR/AcrR family transcriptional regulator [Kineosporiaceae bacterium]|nr:TetR/AcrR family transcriptional regulator [Aeromicrobium sp.]